ncbi:MAG TPA: hypothetical protein EYP43_04005 [Thermoplasmata archaeon]|nr:hypothetical protein [Thermoplasmata archaeon]
MEIEISELSFAFALLDELARRLEGRADVAALGSGVFDWPRLEGTGVRPGISVFLHFKRPDYMVKSTAAEWPLHERPYFRMTIPRRSRSNIHRILRSLSDLEPSTYYVMPLFHTQQELDRLHLLENIIGSTAFIPIHLLAALDDGEHRITGPSASDLLLDGEPLMDVHTGDTLTDRLVEDLSDDQRVSLINREYLQRIYRTLSATIFPGSTADAPADTASTARAISRLMRIYLGGEAVLLMRR